MVRLRLSIDRGMAALAVVAVIVTHTLPFPCW